MPNLRSIVKDLAAAKVITKAVLKPWIPTDSFRRLRCLAIVKTRLLLLCHYNDPDPPLITFIINETLPGRDQDAAPNSSIYFRRVDSRACARHSKGLRASFQGNVSSFQGLRLTFLHSYI